MAITLGEGRVEKRQSGVQPCRYGETVVWPKIERRGMIQDNLATHPIKTKCLAMNPRRKRHAAYQRPVMGTTSIIRVPLRPPPSNQGRISAGLGNRVGDKCENGKKRRTTPPPSDALVILLVAFMTVPFSARIVQWQITQRLRGRALVRSPQPHRPLISLL